MRTDVKVGLVCVLILVIAVVSYFALQGKKDTPPPVAQNSQTPPIPTASPSIPPAAVASTNPAPTGSFAPPTHDAPPLGFNQPSSLGQTPSVYSPPGSPTTAPATPAPPLGGSTLYPPGSSPHTLLPPIGGAPTTMPSTPVPSLGGGMPEPGTPSLPGVGSSSPSLRPGDIEPSLRPRDSLLEPTHGSTTPGGRMSSPSSGGNTYTVVSGDTLSGIAKKTGTTVSGLKAANPSINPDKLKVKQVINLPAAGSSTPASPGSHSDSSRSPGTAATRPAPSSSRHSGDGTIAAGSTYKVKKGDTLRKIAKAAFGDEKLWGRIFRANRGELSSADDLEPGMLLRIPAK
jgi:LysM repeat protein